MSVVATQVKESLESKLFYKEQSNEVALFTHAYEHQLPVLIKGPTGCGKTRFVAHMAERLGKPLYTVACHDDLTAADLDAAVNTIAGSARSMGLVVEG